MNKLTERRKTPEREEFAIWHTISNKTCYITNIMKCRSFPFLFFLFFFQVFFFFLSWWRCSRESSSLYWRENSVRLVSTFLAVGPSGPQRCVQTSHVFIFFLFAGRAHERNFICFIDCSIFFFTRLEIFLKYSNVFLLLRNIRFCFVTKYLLDLF